MAKKRKDNSIKQAKPPRKTISLCMIARDNEQTIGDALASARPWVDEMIVVDTGSTDRTIEIAREQGARVEYFQWCDDFSAARNESLKYASSDWVFWMDTDDTLPKKCGRGLKESLEPEMDENVLGLIMQVHCPSESNRHSKDENLSDATIVDHVKVFRNRDDLRFEGRIHEQILPSIREAGGRIVWTDNYVIHSGSDQSQEGIKKKLERDLRILRLDIEERPEHPFVHFNLGMTLLHMGQYDEAEKALENCILRSVTQESHLRKAYAMLVDVYSKQSKSKQAISKCWEALGRYPNDPEVSFQLGRMLMLNMDWDGAIDAFNRVQNLSDDRYFASIDAGIKGHKTYANLANCHMQLSNWSEAIDCWIDCLESTPDFEDAWSSIFDLSRRLESTKPLQRCLKTFKENAATRVFTGICQALIAGMRGKTKEAINKFEVLLDEFPSMVLLLNEFARYLHDLQKWETLLPILHSLRDTNPNNPSPHFNIGVCHLKMEDFERASKAFEIALQLRPEHKPTQELLEKSQRDDLSKVKVADQETV